MNLSAMRATAFSNCSSALSALMVGFPPLGFGEHGLKLPNGERGALRLGDWLCSLRSPERRRAHVNAEALVRLAHGGVLGLRIKACVYVERQYYLRVFALIVVVVVAMIVVLSFVGALLLRFVYGTSIEEYTYLFPLVMVSTGEIALVWFLTDSLVIARCMRGVLIMNTGAFVVCLVSMVPLETSFGMNGINSTVIISVLVGIGLGVCFLRASIDASLE